MVDSIYPYEIKTAAGGGFIATCKGAELGGFSSVEEAAARIAKDVADGYPEILWDFVADFAQERGVDLKPAIVSDDRFQDALAEEIVAFHEGPAPSMAR